MHSRGRGREECQILWLSSWDAPKVIAKVVHPKHVAHRGGFVLEDRWLNDFWMELGNTNMGIRVQVHTHPQEAFHSPTDDEFPIIHKPGFLSLVIPNFGLGPVGFRDAYLTEIQIDGELATGAHPLAAVAHMTLRQALDRTLLLMRDEVREDVGDDTLLPKGIDNICEAGSRGAGRVGRVRASLKPQNRPPRR